MTVEIIQAFVESVKKIHSYLSIDASSRDLEEGALLLLQMNRNRILYDNIVRRNMSDKLEYELRKMLDFRLVKLGLSLDDVLSLDQVDPNDVKDEFPALLSEAELIGDSLSERFHLGQRSDHESLPASVQCLYDENITLYKRIKQAHENLRALAAAKDCDRLPFVREIIRVSERLEKGWQAYDEFDPVLDVLPGNNVDLASTISTGRSFISRRKSALKKALSADSSEEKLLVLRNEIAKRVQELRELGAEFSEENLSSLVELGVAID